MGAAVAAQPAIIEPGRDKKSGELPRIDLSRQRLKRLRQSSRSAKCGMLSSTALRSRLVPT
jgi:hypothetical protein